MIKKLITILSLPAFLVVSMALLLFSGDEIKLNGFGADTCDGCITLDWNINYTYAFPSPSVRTVLTIEGEDYSERVVLPLRQTEYSFFSGRSGKAYVFSIYLESFGKQICDSLSCRALFVDYSAAPDCPLLVIETDSHRDPTCEYVSRPNEHCAGATIRNNDYVAGNILIFEDGKESFSSRLEIRIRGNTSAGGAKKPYKIKLDEPADLLNRKAEHAYSEWALINFESLRTPIGTYIANLCRSEWQPEFRCVNLILNGDWKGSYLLIESVEAGENKIAVSENGFVLEDDAYWWNCSEEYFKSFIQQIVYAKSGGMGYTFKYPSYGSSSEYDRSIIAEAVNRAERALFSGDSSYSDYIDVSSFSSWLLTHDILGNNDSMGSNIFLYSTDIDELEGSGKIRLGPVWDMDNTLVRKDNWSAEHNSFYFFELLKHSDFLEEYTDMLYELSGMDFSDLSRIIERLNRATEDSIDDSWAYNAVRWEKEIKPYSAQLSTAAAYITGRLKWMCEALPQVSVNIESGICVYERENNVLVVEFRAAAEYSTVVIPIWVDDDNGQDDLVWYEAEYAGDNIWTVSVNTVEHGGTGRYIIHVYSKDSDGNNEFITDRAYVYIQSEE